MAKVLLGIDLGGRTTGKTAVCRLALQEDGKANAHVITTDEVTAQCDTDDDRFVALLLLQKPVLIGIDAPLSLPDTTRPDYLFRPSDRAVGALSPFSMGEVTARALYLSNKLRGIPLVEVYPKAVLKHLGLPYRKYKNDGVLLHEMVERVQAVYGWQIAPFALTGDNVDALLAAVAAWHFDAGAYTNLAGSGEPPFIAPV